MSGYTIQIATVSQRDTVESLLKKLHSVPDIRVAKYKQFWVVLVGQFSDSQSAQQAAAELVKQYRLSQPMIKKWAELGGYQLQDALPSGEISE